VSTLPPAYLPETPSLEKLSFLYSMSLLIDAWMICWTSVNKAKIVVTSFPISFRFLFLTDWSYSSPKIERTTLAGTQRTVLVDLRNATQYWPNAVIVDYREDRIYWIDAWIDAIESCDLYGKHRRKLTSPLHPSFNMHPFDLTVYDDILYWSDWNTDSIERLNWTTAAYLGGFGILTSDRVFGVALLDDSRQPASAGKQNQITPVSRDPHHL